MTITPCSLMSAVLWSSVFMVLLYFFRKNTGLLAVLGVTPLLFLGLGTGLRSLFPLMVPNYTRLVHLQGFFCGSLPPDGSASFPFACDTGRITLCCLGGGNAVSRGSGNLEIPAVSSKAASL